MPYRETLARWKLAQQASHCAEIEYQAALHQGLSAGQERAHLLTLEERAETLLQQVVAEVSRASKREAKP